MVQGKYRRVKVTPTCNEADATANGENIFALTKIPNACPRGGVSVLKYIRVWRKEDFATDIELHFFGNGTVTMGDAGAASTAINQSDTNAPLADPLGLVIVDVDKWDLNDLTENRLYLNRPSKNAESVIDLPVFSTGDPTDAQRTASNADGTKNTSEDGAIYFVGVSTTSETYTASGLTFEFIFEVL